MKKIVFIIMALLLLFCPIRAYANIICNDGTTSATCTDCHTGCCSRHGGCTNNPNNGGNTAPAQSSPQPAPTPAPTPEPSPVEEPTQVPESQVAEDNDNSSIEDESDNNSYGSNSYYGDAESNDDDSASTVGGIVTLGAIGAAVYVASKKRR